MVRLTTPEFFAAVLAPRPAIAVFDCDGTLWSGDAGYGFMVWSMESGLVSRNASDWIDSQYRLYRSGEVSEAEMCGEMVQVYAGLREDELRKATAEYFHAEIEAHIFPEMRELVSQLQAGGTEIWAVSSTNNWLIEEAVREFGIPAERVLAAKVRVKDGAITSQLIDVPTDEGKAISLERGWRTVSGCGFRQLDPRCGDAGDREAGLSRECDTGTVTNCRRQGMAGVLSGVGERVNLRLTEAASAEALRYCAARAARL